VGGGERLLEQDRDVATVGEGGGEGRERAGGGDRGEGGAGVKTNV
jgi:hypothetical protein